MTDATTGDQVDNKVSELENAICDINGIPIDTPISNAGFLWDAAGLKKVIFQDNAADPAAVGQLNRNGTVLSINNGLYVCRIPQSVNNDNTPVTVTNGTGEIAVFAHTLKGGSLGTTRRLRLTTVGTFSILSSGLVTFRFQIDAVNFVTHTLFGGSSTAKVNLPWRCVLEIFMNGATNSYRGYSTAMVPAGTVGDHPGFGGQNGSNVDLAEQDSITDLAIDRVIRLTFQWNTQSPNNTIAYNQSVLEILP